MTNDKNIINKLTKGLKFKINKKKSNWKTLNSRDSLPPTPTDEYMLYSDTEAELYHAKVNVEANRSFSYHNTSYNNESNFNANTHNILAGLNSNTSNFVNRSKTAYNRPTTNTYTYNSTINIRNQQNSQSSKNNLLYPNNIVESRKNSFQTAIANSPSSNTNPIPINYTSSSTNSTSYLSAPNSPLSIDSSDTYVNDLKVSSNNPFKANINSSTSIHPKATTNQINTQLTVATANMDPALSHTLISPIEFDGSGNEIKSNSNGNTVTFDINTTTIESSNNNDNTTPNKQNKEQSTSRSKSVKRIKPLITFDTPPVVSPMAPGSDSDDNVRGRKRGGKKSKKYSKKRSSPLLTLRTSELKDSTRDIPTYTYGKFKSEPSSVIAARANKRMNSPTEEDDDVPLGIIQYKCLSSILQESAPTNISSLQSNTKVYKSSHVKDNYGYISPSEYCSQEKYDFPKYSNYSNYYHENYVI